MLSSAARHVRTTSLLRHLSNKKPTILTRVMSSTAAPFSPERYLADAQPPYSCLQVKPFFESLSSQEKHYAHYMSRASFEGTRIIVQQTNPAANGIYDLILHVFSKDGSLADLKELAAKSGVSSEAFEQCVQYAGQFLGNLSNYKSFGDEKFIPRLSPEDFEKIVAASGSNQASQLFAELKKEIYSVEDTERNLLGFAEDGHLSGYYSSDITKAEIQKVQEYLEQAKIEPHNTRLFKTPNGYRLAVASAQKGTKQHRLPDGTELEISYGDFEQQMTRIAENIAHAKRYAANEHQSQMLDAYHDSFVTGSIEAHMDSQRHWLKDIGPTVETNIGFIETYRDPQGVRAEWEGFVAMVNQEQTRKFSTLVESAPQFVSRLPWPAAFERDTINKPDFTSLEVLSFATAGIPSGINIPNYTNITQVLGSKNVSLGNIISAQSPSEKFPFVREQDLEVYRKYRNPSFEVQVGTHELGHGTGKLFEEAEDGSLNFDAKTTLNPLTGKPVSTWYKPGQTFSSLFKAIAASYEECRAECIALTLGHHADILDIFNFKGQEAEDVLFVMYLNMARAGLVAMEFYNPDSKKWGQAHMQARYAIMNVMLKAGQGFVTIEREGDQLEIHMDRSKIRSVGAPAVADFLAKLQIYKATADEEKGTAFYLEATSVPEEWIELRDIVLKNKQPRKCFVQPNTLIDGDQVVLKEYDPSPEGMIQSYIERHV